MAPTLLKLSCPHCNGMLELTSRADLFKCAHCSHLALLHWAESATPAISKLVEKTKWKANCLRPGSSVNWQGGELLVTAQELAFVPHDFNFGPLERAVIPLAAIKEQKLVEGAVAIISDIVSVTELAGDEWSFRVHGGEKLHAEIQQARTALRG